MEKLEQLEQFCVERGIRCDRAVPLREYCTFKIGGSADLFLRPASEGDIHMALEASKRLDIPLLLLGKGSNMLFSDGGFRGAVMHLGPAYAGMRLGDDGVVHCDSGASLMQLCLFAQEHGLAGLEFAYGIPGSVGGAIYMNAGAYGGEIKDVLRASRHVGPGGPGRFAGGEMQLSYRHSAYCDLPFVVTGGEFRLERDDPAAIRARMDDYMNRRRTKQPLDYPSAGSTFKRPQGAYASALIDQCGLKGLRVGGAMVSEKHAGFVVNTGGATGADVRELIARVQREVMEKTGFRLECEVRVIEP